MTIALIFAINHNNVIGDRGKLPWHLSNDLKRFKEITTGGTVVMGRKTFESIGKPLPKRRNIVLSRDSNYKHDGIEVLHSIDDIENISKNETVFIIGGAEIYRMFENVSDVLYITVVDSDMEGDTKFYINLNNGWRLIEEIDGFKDEKNEYNYKFLKYERKK